MPEECSYPLIDIGGTPGEMGRSHGTQLRERIRRTVAAMRGQIGREPYDASWADFQATVAYCRQHAPDLIVEVEGIAAGAGIDFRDAFNISAHLDLSNWKRKVWGECGSADAGACSSHAVVTRSDVLLAWNGDDWRGWMDCGAIVRGRPDDAEPFIYWSLAGSVGRPGMNRHLALGANSLPSSRWRPDGLLYPMLSRKVLACRNTEEAVAVFEKHGRCAANNYLIADRSGLLASVEADVDDCAVLRPDTSGVGSHLLHTNSYLDSERAGRAVDPDTVCPRLTAARQLYRDQTPADPAQVRAIQSDHTGGICVHRDQVCTIISFVAEIRTGRFHVTRGNPCEMPVETHSID